MEINACHITNIGKVRRNNEDSILLNEHLVSGVSMREPACSLLKSEKVICLVADGMGGHNKGEVASRKVLETFRSHYEVAEDEDDMRRIIGLAREDLDSLVRNDRSSFGLGTTVSGILLAAGRAVVLNCGDSRVYRLNGRHLVKLTKDHSLVQELLDSGVITEDEMRTHPHKNIVTSAVMGDLRETPIELFFRDLPLETGQRFLVCTDGLWESVTRGQMEECFTGRDLSQTADCLFAKAMERGGRDNVSFIVLEIEG